VIRWVGILMIVGSVMFMRWTKRCVLFSIYIEPSHSTHTLVSLYHFSCMSSRGLKPLTIFCLGLFFDPSRLDYVFYILLGADCFVAMCP
jgi:hypothetical protein